MKNKSKTICNFIYFIASIILFFIIIGNSIIYYDTTTDVNVWTYIGNMMKSGKTIYSDLFDHKGPMLYFFFYFLGNYKLLVELIIFIINEILIYKIAEIIIDSKNNIKSLIITTIGMSLLINSLSDFPNTESYSIPFILFSMYVFIKNYKTELNPKSFFKISFCMTIVLLLRINLITFWVVIYLYYLVKMTIERKFKTLFEIIKYSFLGVITCLIPVIIYLIYKGAFKDFIYNYIIFNLKYAFGESGISIIHIVLFFFSKTLYIYPIMIFINIVLMFLKSIKKEEKILLLLNLLYFIFTLYVVISPKRPYLHYSIILMPCVIIILSLLFKDDNRFVVLGMVCILFIILLIYTGYYITKINIDNNQDYKNHLEEIASWLDKNTKEEDNILVLGNEVVIYNLSNRSYKGKYFYQYPIFCYSTEIADEIVEEVSNQLPDYIILNDYKIPNNKVIDERIIEIIKEKYTKIQEFAYERNK